MKFFTAIIFFYIASLPSLSLAEDVELTLRQNFIEFESSYFSASFDFRCGDSTFKLKKKIFKSPQLFWKSNLDWIELDSLVLKDTGVQFYGLGKKGGVPINKMDVVLNLPIHNKMVNAFGISVTPRSYYGADFNDVFSAYGYSIDFYKEEMVRSNLAPIIDTIRLDVKKYRREQKESGSLYAKGGLLGNLNLSSQLFFSQASEQRAQSEIDTYNKATYLSTYDEKRKADATRALEKSRGDIKEIERKIREEEKLDVTREMKLHSIVNEFSKPIKVVTPSLKYEIRNYCFLVK